MSLKKNDSSNCSFNPTRSAVHSTAPAAFDEPSSPRPSALAAISSTATSPAASAAGVLASGTRLSSCGGNSDCGPFGARRATSRSSSIASSGDTRNASATCASGTAMITASSTTRAAAEAGRPSNAATCPNICPGATSPSVVTASPSPTSSTTCPLSNK